MAQLPSAVPEHRRNGENRRGRWSALWRWILPLFVLVALWGSEPIFSRAHTPPEVSYSAFYSLVDEDKVQKVTIRGQAATVVLNSEQPIDGRSSREFRVVLPSREDPELFPKLRQHRVNVTIQSEEQPVAITLLFTVLPWVLIFAGWYWLSTRAQKAMTTGGGLFGGVMKGRARRFSEQTDVRVRFADVAGLTSAKRDLAEIVDFLKNPARYAQSGARVPRGVLLLGPPGTGKTLLARAVAGEAGVPFFSINGSEFIELFVGVGASRVRELFDAAKAVAPAIVFIDEIDAIGRARGTGLGGGHDEREQTLNQLLSELDGFARNDLTVLIAATNRPDVLDAALLRPGRFDRRVVVERPERAARLAILGVHTRNKPLASGVVLEDIAAATAGLSGADLANLVNEAALAAARRGGAVGITQADFWNALDKVIIGDPRELVIAPEVRRRIAVHESGHALVAHLSPNAESVKRVTIIPHGLALGATQQLAREDRQVVTNTDLLTKLRVLVAGHAAEHLVFGEGSSGVQRDLEQATDIAYDMVTHFGMSDAVGPVFYEHKREHPFLGERIASEGETSEATARLLDEEVRRLLAAATVEATGILSRHRQLFDALVSALLEHETVEREDFLRIVGEGAEPAEAEPREKTATCPASTRDSTARPHGAQ